MSIKGPPTWRSSGFRRKKQPIEWPLPPSSSILVRVRRVMFKRMPRCQLYTCVKSDVHRMNYTTSNNDRVGWDETACSMLMTHRSTSLWTPIVQLVLLIFLGHALKMGYRIQRTCWSAIKEKPKLFFSPHDSVRTMNYCRPVPLETTRSQSQKRLVTLV